MIILRGWLYLRAKDAFKKNNIAMIYIQLGNYQKVLWPSG